MRGEQCCPPAPPQLARRAQVPRPVGLAVPRHRIAALSDVPGDHPRGVRAPGAPTRHGQHLHPAPLTNGFTHPPGQPPRRHTGHGGPPISSPSILRAGGNAAQGSNVLTGPGTTVGAAGRQNEERCRSRRRGTPGRCATSGPTVEQRGFRERRSPRDHTFTVAGASGGSRPTRFFGPFDPSPTAPVRRMLIHSGRLTPRRLEGESLPERGS